MKKIFLAAVILSLYTLPVFAACSITGNACSINSDINTDAVNTHINNNMQPTFHQDYIRQYNSDTINIDSLLKPQSNTYNSNCQFGICLPQNYPADTIK